MDCAQVEEATHIEVPGHLSERRVANVDLLCETISATRLALHGRGRVTRASEGIVTEIVVQTSSGELLVSVGRRSGNRQEPMQLEVADLRLTDGRIQCVEPTKWAIHPLIGSMTPELRDRIAQSWREGIRFSTPDGSEGLREPQIGALHALASEWTLERRQSIVVMPTGTGKTEVMLAAMVQRRAQRLLVLVPSDPLRSQTARKFVTLGVLKPIGAVSENTRPPIVAIPRKRPDDAAIAALQLANVVVSTVAMLAKLQEPDLRALLSLFDVVFLDEAHHAPAPSWQRILDAAKHLQVTGFTATPFRNDGTRISGKIIYQYPLGRAQSKGYFERIRFEAIDEIDADLADRLIAEKAITRLREDRASDLQHVLLARAATIRRAEELFSLYYNAIAPDLAPVVVHSRTSGKKRVLEDIRRGVHKIVVCVDMFGEGIDVPSLKIAAMHDVYKSLAITLQFVGRFTRTAQQLGPATLLANLADERVGYAIEDLYAEDADWNLLIPELSARAIAGQVNLQEFIDQMQGTADDDSEFDLGILRPSTSTVIYRTDIFEPRRIRGAMMRNVRIKKMWLSRDRSICIFVTKTHDPIDWAPIKAVANEIWDLTICRFDRQRRLLYIYGSQSSTTHRALAKAVTRGRASLIRGEQMFRAFSGLERLVFQNVGLSGRGKTRFKMFTGFDVSEAVAPAMQANSTKSNIFAVGFERGVRQSIGVSKKGKVWSMRSSTVPEWMQWCDHVSEKITDDALSSTSFLQHTLIPEEITAFPNRPVLCVLQPDEWLYDSEGTLKFIAGGDSYNRVQVDVIRWTLNQSGTLGVVVDVGGAECEIELHWTSQGFGAVQVGGRPVFIRAQGQDVPLHEHLSETPPVILFHDGSELIGSKLLRNQLAQPLLFDVANVRAIDWAGVDIRLESKWKNGVQRDQSVQGAVIDECLRRNSEIVFDDDDKGEIADVIEIVTTPHTATIRLFHCKYAGGVNAGMRVDDLYEVCGQAVRSVRVISDPEEVLRRLLLRDQPRSRGGRPSRFERGTPKAVRALLKRASRVRFSFEIVVVQPGLLHDQLTPNAAAILASADMYIRQFSGSPLVVYAS